MRRPRVLTLDQMEHLKIVEAKYSRYRKLREDADSSYRELVDVLVEGRSMGISTTQLGKSVRLTPTRISQVTAPKEEQPGEENVHEDPE